MASLEETLSQMEMDFAVGKNEETKNQESLLMKLHQLKSNTGFQLQTAGKLLKLSLNKFASSYCEFIEKTSQNDLTRV